MYHYESLINIPKKMHSLYIILSAHDQANQILDTDWSKPFCNAPPWFTRPSDYWHAYMNVIMIDLSSAQWNLCIDFLHLLSACVNTRRFTEEISKALSSTLSHYTFKECSTFHHESKGKIIRAVSMNAHQWTFLISSASNNLQHFFKSRERLISLLLLYYIGILEK